LAWEDSWWRFRLTAASARISCRGNFFSCREKKIPSRAVDNFLPWKIFFVPWKFFSHGTKWGTLQNEIIQMLKAEQSQLPSLKAKTRYTSVRTSRFTISI